MIEREKAHLAQTIEKIRKKIEETNQTLSQGQQEIDSMQNYFWMNYTEMDEYGYEYYDNQQALLQQVNANQSQAQYRRRLLRMLDSPYFGRVDFRYEDEEEAETFYIGLGNFAERTGAVPLIYDWRAPVSSLFYDFDQGSAFYQVLENTLYGEITSKYQYKIKDGKLIYAIESDMKIDDDILRAELGNHGDTSLKNIVRTIQQEQNAIIRNTRDKILVIQGAAGSGKTSIALHRIAYLLYHDRKNLKSSNVLILSPNGVFSDYISHILPELGEENIQEMSFDIFAYRELRDTVEDCEDRYDHLERMMDRPQGELERRYKEKQSSSFAGMVEAFLAGLEDELVDLQDVEYKGFTKSQEELIQLFYFRFQETPLLARMNRVIEYFVDELETLQRKNLAEEELEVIRDKFYRMYVTRDIYRIYNWLLEENGYMTLPDVEYEKRKLYYEDVYPMLYLKYRLLGQTARQEMKHVVIDEMQDYSYLQYLILHDMFRCRMTILGDRAQTLDSECNDVLRFLQKIYGKDIHPIEIKKSYRNTIEIARYASAITGVTDLEFLERHGKDVVEKDCASREELLKEIAYNSEQEDYETRAVITMTEQEAYEIAKALERNGLRVNYMDRNSTTFRKGLTVTTFYLAKGLEFDQVFGVIQGQDPGMVQQAKYITATRALHELYMYKIKD